MKLSRIVLLAITMFASLPVFATGTLPSSPQLNLILPRGVQRGHEHVLNFRGARLEDAEEVFLYDPIGVEVKSIEVVDAANINVTIIVAEDCRIGEFMAQIRTRSGVSEFRSFFVGSLPAIAEVEPNSEFDQPQRIDLNVTVDGICTSEDVDYYVVTCQKGQRLNVEIEGIRLGTTFFDPFIAVFDKDRFELAVCDDSPFTKQDAYISMIVPEDGDYTILVRDSAYLGSATSYYRLHVGTFPRPTVAFPGGGKTGESLSVRFVGDAAGDVVNEITVPEQNLGPTTIAVTDALGVSPSPVSFNFSDLDNFMEVEPNDDFDQANVCVLPIALNGIIHDANQVDWFKFEAKKDAVYDIECYARRLCSGLDAVINIYNSEKQDVVGNDDGRGLDAYLRWTCPADGEYYLRVRDHLNRGGPDFVYRVEIAPPKPQLTIGIPRVDRYSQYRQSVFVPQGGRFATQFSVTRVNFGGEVGIDPSGLPQGVTMVGGPTVGNLGMMPIVFEAAEDAPIGGALVDVIARHTENAEIHGVYSNIADFVLGPPNNARYIAGTVTKLPIIVVERLPFKLEMIQPKAPLVREGRIAIRVVAHRDEGFTKPIQLQFPFLPPGVGSSGTVAIPEGENEAVFPLNANAQAQLGDWQVYVLGSADVGGPAWQATQMATLKIADRYLTVDISPAACEQGQTTTVICKVNPLNEFTGAGTAELIGLPHEAASEKLEVTPGMQELHFKVTTTGNTPPGKHKGVFCQLTVIEQEEPVIAVAGRGELQVDVPLPQPTATEPVAATPPEAAPPAEKPLTRLEKLRLEAQKLRDARNKKNENQ